MTQITPFPSPTFPYQISWKILPNDFIFPDDPVDNINQHYKRIYNRLSLPVTMVIPTDLRSGILPNREGSSVNQFSQLYLSDRRFEPISFKFLQRIAKFSNTSDRDPRIRITLRVKSKSDQAGDLTKP